MKKFHLKFLKMNPCGGLILLDADLKIILVKNRNHNWSFPKGKFECGVDKDNYHCARREFLEETGLVGFTYNYSTMTMTEERNSKTMCILYVCQIIEKHSDYGFIPGHADIDGDIIEVSFKTIEQINALDLFNDRRKAIATRVVSRMADPNHPPLSETDMFLNPNKCTHISKACTTLLRHKFNEFRTKHSNATVEMSELISKLNRNSKNQITEAEIRHVSKYCPKQRTQIIDSETGVSRIGAVQGHKGETSGIDVNELMDEITTPLTKCYHVTNRKAVAIIKANGLSIMGRQHIHFAQESHLLRRGQDITIEVKMAEAMEAGIIFYRAKNGVILSSGIEGIIPAAFLIFSDNVLSHKKKH